MEGAGNNIEMLDLLRKFTKTQSECQEKSKAQEEEEEGEEEKDEDMELSLGLSMNGRFGVDPTRTQKLKRSSSFIANAAPAGETGPSAGASGAAFGADAPLSRTQSLPVETEEWRRRKELQSMRRMEARKKRMEKLKNLRVPRDGNGGKNEPHEFANGDSDCQRLGKRILRRVENGEVIESSSQGSIRPLRSGSSGSSDLTEGWKQNTEVSPSNRMQSSNGLHPLGRASERETKAQQVKKNKMHHEMPYVTTKETGPNGRRVEGFLYGYKRGEDVRIMCVCHGSFLSPKEFVEHGGVRGKVEHPLKHIVVNPFPLL